MWSRAYRLRILVPAVVVLLMVTPSVLAAPPHDERQNAKPILLPAHRDEVDTTTATINWHDPWYGCAGFNGYSDHTVWYAFTTLTPIPVLVSTEGSDHDTVLDAFIQKSDGRLTRVACSHHIGLAHSGFVLEPVPGTTYWIQAGAFSLAWGPSPGGHLEFSVAPCVE